MEISDLRSRGVKCYNFVTIFPYFLPQKNNLLTFKITPCHFHKICLADSYFFSVHFFGFGTRKRCELFFEDIQEDSADKVVTVIIIIVSLLNSAGH